MELRPHRRLLLPIVCQDSAIGEESAQAVARMWTQRGFVLVTDSVEGTVCEGVWMNPSKDMLLHSLVTTLRGLAPDDLLVVHVVGYGTDNFADSEVWLPVHGASTTEGTLW